MVSWSPKHISLLRGCLVISIFVFPPTYCRLPLHLSIAATQSKKLDSHGASLNFIVQFATYTLHYFLMQYAWSSNYMVIWWISFSVSVHSGHLFTTISQWPPTITQCYFKFQLLMFYYTICNILNTVSQSI